MNEWFYGIAVGRFRLVQPRIPTRTLSGAILARPRSLSRIWRSASRDYHRQLLKLGVAWISRSKKPVFTAGINSAPPRDVPEVFWSVVS